MDWNNDGLDDFILGDMAGYVNFFQRDGAGIYDLQAPVHLTMMEEDIKVESMAGPVTLFTAYDGTRTRLDWNEDGLADLILGSATLTLTPNLQLYLNSGTNENPVFTSFSFVEAAGEPIEVSRFVPQIVDLNGDGLKDIIAGNHYGQILFFQNVGTNFAPVFPQQVSLCSGGQPIDINTGSKIWVEDMNGDGILDILASDYDGMVFLFPGLPNSSVENAEAAVNQPPMFQILNSPVSSGSIAINLTVPTTQSFSMQIFDCCGRIVFSHDLGFVNPGVHPHLISIPQVQPGVYFVSIRGEENSCCQKVTVLR